MDPLGYRKSIPVENDRSHESASAAAAAAVPLPRVELLKTEEMEGWKRGNYTTGESLSGLGVTWLLTMPWAEKPPLK